MATRKSSASAHITTDPKTLAGDPFAYEGEKRPDPDRETPHGCIDGWVYLGFEGEDSEANGEHVEEIERVPCRRCKAGGEA